MRKLSRIDDSSSIDEHAGRGYLGHASSVTRRESPTWREPETKKAERPAKPLRCSLGPEQHSSSQSKAVDIVRACARWRRTPGANRGRTAARRGERRHSDGTSATALSNSEMSATSTPLTSEITVARPERPPRRAGWSAATSSDHHSFDAEDGIASWRRASRCRSPRSWIPDPLDGIRALPDSSGSFRHLA